MCTSYVSSLVQYSNAKVLSYKQKCKHTNSIGSHSKLVCQSWFTQNEEIEKHKQHNHGIHNAGNREQWPNRFRLKTTKERLRKRCEIPTI